ncbi:type II secretion system F family protein [Marimonas arenosa]|uniref:Type II secretion system F family protein n=1 Tax=Marimonas arenosa TaxID=1795305 RepID=A0AAE4B3Z1_9RHOB|nr:type II secretion system F family protein [Marimonas arenosa]MDQ2089690.1 type II secretion system F family protein [Marimonas arenosa]
MENLLTVEVINYMVYAGTFLGILLLFTGVAQLAQRGETRGEARSRRMQMIDKGADIEEILSVLKPPRKTGVWAHIPLIGQLPDLLSQAGMTISTNRFLFFCGLATITVFSVASVILILPVAVLVGLGIGFLVPLLVVKSRRDTRMKKLVEQLPDALELMARGLRVGHPLNTSIGSVAQEMPDPIGTEFGLIFDQISFGDDLPDAVQEFADRVGLEDVQYLSASIGIQHGTGGDLARVIRILAKVIRDRLTMRQKILAISSEGRLTAVFLSALPVLIFVFTTITNPTYFGGVRDDPLFVPMMVTIAVLTVLNFLVLRKLVHFRV